MNPQARLLFWLLVAATIAVDVIAIMKLRQEGPVSRVVYVYDALVTGQLATACVWATFSRNPLWLRWGGVLAAVATAALLGIPFAQFEPAESFGLYGSFAATLMIALWLLSCTRWWKRTTQLGSAAWQFSLSQLLVVMTLSALLITALRASELLFGDFPIWKVLLVLTISDVLVVMITLAAWTTAWQFIMRLAAAIAGAAFIGILQTLLASVGAFGPEVVSTVEQDLAPDLVYRILMALVLFAWLEIGGIVPVDRRAEASPPAGNAR